jgi:hypothetical protein
MIPIMFTPYHSDEVKGPQRPLDEIECLFLQSYNMLSYLFVPEIAANIMSFVTESLADYRYRRRLIKDEFLRACYDNAWLLPPKPHHTSDAFMVNTKEDADRFNVEAPTNKNICGLKVQTSDMLQYIDKIPGHMGYVHVKQHITDYNEAMTALRHILVSPYTCSLHLWRESSIRIAMSRKRHDSLIILFDTLTHPAIQDVSDPLTQITCSRISNGPIIDVSECENIIAVRGDISRLQGVKYEKLTIVSASPELLDADILRRLHSIENLSITSENDTGIIVDLTEMPVDNLRSLILDNVVIIGLSMLPKLNTLCIYESSIMSHLYAPMLRTLDARDRISLTIGDGPHNGPISINVPSVNELIVDGIVYSHVRGAHNVEHLAIHNTSDEMFTLQCHAALKSLFIHNSNNIALSAQHSLRSLQMKRDDAIAATIFGTDAIEYIDNKGDYVHAA